MTARVSVAALALGLMAALAAGQQSQPAAPKASVRDAIYFGPAGPVRIRLHISIDGKAADAVWNEAIESLFAHRDADGDGLLNAAERTPFVQQGRVPRELDLVQFDGQPALQPLRLTFNQKDDKVSRAAFAEAMRAATRGPIALRVVPVSADSPQLSAALFRQLDENKDGRLSALELKAARERLTFLDLDEDEFITTAELLGRAVGANNPRQRLVVPGTQQRPEPADTSGDLVFLPADAGQAVKQLLTARGKPRATSLKAAEFGVDAKAFAALDQDGNGALDTAELTAWLQKPPALELAVSFDSGGAKLTALSPASHPVEKNGSVAAALPGGRFRFEPPAGVPAKEWKQAADRLRDVFREQGGWLGLVWRKQVEAQPATLPFFDFADRRAAGVIRAAEVEAALKAAVPLAGCRVDVAFADQGDGLFELLDRDRDGRLSPRELAEAAAVLKPYFATDGSLSPKDLVRQFQVRVAVDPLPVGVLFQPTQATAGDPQQPRSSAPAWFTKMDRNGDGDLSLREFVGPVELFRRLDRDGDGLIGRTEANAAEK
jgi:Ca2+-binding EF-hand superfamily protein